MEGKRSKAVAVAAAPRTVTYRICITWFDCHDSPIRDILKFMGEACGFIERMMREEHSAHLRVNFGGSIRTDQTLIT